jgi:hypothetical protein
VQLSASSLAPSTGPWSSQYSSLLRQSGWATPSSVIIEQAFCFTNVTHNSISISSDTARLFISPRDLYHVTAGKTRLRSAYEATHSPTLPSPRIKIKHSITKLTKWRPQALVCERPFGIQPTLKIQVKKPMKPWTKKVNSWIIYKPGHILGKRANNYTSEQESLIRNLRVQNETWNKTYTKILFALPLVSIFPYIFSFLDSASKRPPILSLLSISSLLSTAYLVYIFPSETTGLTLVDKHSKVVKSRQEKLGQGENGPIRKYLPNLNVALCIAILGLGKLVSGKDDGGEWIILNALPTGAYTVVILGSTSFSNTKNLTT